jgi:hypothetical protein
MMEYIEKAVAGAKNLIPPAEGASEAHVKRWRMWIAAATFLNALGLSAHIALACGFAAPFYSGFAQAGELQDLRNSLEARRVRELSTLLLDAKAKQCTASGDAGRLYLAVYNDLRVEYLQLTKREFPDPPCDNFR